MLKNDTLINGTSRIGLYGSAPLRGWGNFAPSQGIRPSFFAPGHGIRQKNCPGGRDSLAQKNFPGDCPGEFIQLELTETLYRYIKFQRKLY